MIRVHDIKNSALYAWGKYQIKGSVFLCVVATPGQERHSVVGLVKGRMCVFLCCCTIPRQNKSPRLRRDKTSGAVSINCLPWNYMWDGNERTKQGYEMGSQSFERKQTSHTYKCRALCVSCSVSEITKLKSGEHQLFVLKLNEWRNIKGEIRWEVKVSKPQTNALAFV